MSYDGKKDTLKDLNFTIPDGTLVSLLVIRMSLKKMP